MASASIPESKTGAFDAAFVTADAARFKSFAWESKDVREGLGPIADRIGQVEDITAGTALLLGLLEKDLFLDDGDSPLLCSMDRGALIRHLISVNSMAADLLAEDRDNRALWETNFGTKHSVPSRGVTQ